LYSLLILTDESQLNRRCLRMSNNVKPKFMNAEYSNNALQLQWQSLSLRLVSARFLLIILLAACFLFIVMTDQAHAFGDVRQPNLEYVETNVDLKVKVLGGYVQIRRTWSEGRWYLNPTWADLKFTLDPLDNSVKSVERAGSPFVKSGNGIYIFDRQFFIKREADTSNVTTGWRWYDRRGNYVTYNPLGKITSYGNRNDVKVSFVYSGDGKLATVNDHFGAVALTYTYTGDLLTKITDRGGRNVQYAYTGTGATARFTTVTDAAGYAWTYTYNTDGQITSVTDPETRAWTITYLSSVQTPGGSLSVSGAAKSAGGTFATVGKSASADMPATASALGSFAGSQSSNPAENPIGSGIGGARAFSSASLAKETALPSSSGSSSGGQKIARVGKVVDPLNFETAYGIDYDRVARRYTTTAKYPGGRRTEQTYDIEGRMLSGEVGIRKTSQLNRITPFEEEAADERGLVTKSLYDAARNLLKITYPDGSSVTTTYDANYSLPLARIDEAGVKTVYEYDSKGNLTKMTEAQGLPEQRVTSFSYDSYGQNLTMKVEARAASGGLPATAEAITIYTYDTLGNSTSITNAEGNKTEYLDFDARGLATKMKDPRGNTSTMSYNPLGWKLSEANALGHTVTHAYDKVGNRIAVTDPKSNITRYRYSSRNELIEITDPLGGLTSYEYDGERRRTKKIDAGNGASRVAITSSYDGDGRLSTSTDGNGNVTAHVYGGSGDGLDGLLKRVAFPTYVEEYKYDSRSRMVQTTQILDSSGSANATRYTILKEYDARGNMVSQTDPLGRKTKMEYDGLNRLVKTTDPIGGVTQQIYDTRDNLTTLIDAAASRTKYEYDRSNRLTKETRPLGDASTYNYDPNNNFISRTNAKGEAQVYAFDAANRRTSEQHFAAGVIPAPATGTARNAARTVIYSFDERGLVTGYTDTGDINLTGAGIVATANSGTYGYDNKGQKTSETITVQIGGTASSPISTTKITTTTYHPNGLKASITYPTISNSGGGSAGTATYAYDSNNQLKKITTPNNQSIDITAYKWTAPTQKVIPGAVINMSYDALLRATGLVSRAINGTGTTGTAQAPLGPTIYDTRPTFNEVSNITKRDTDHGSYSYGYDDLDRLTQVISPPPIVTSSVNNTGSITLPTEGYTYDAVHNRKSSLHQTGSIANAWMYNAHHQLTQWGDPNAAANNNTAQPKISQTFDVNGHLATKIVTPEDASVNGVKSGRQSQRFTYNTGERMVRVGDGSTANANQGNEIANYAYDPFGRRIKKTVIQAITPDSRLGVTLYFYGDEGLMAEVDGSSGNILTTYGWMLNETWGTSPVFKRDFVGQSSVEHYYHVDHLGTPERLTNQAGEITWRSYSEGFGKTTVDTSVTPTTTATTINNLRFPGQYEDPETNTRYNYFRDYDTATGRYLQSDPISLLGGENTYAYVENQPTVQFDPTGEIAPIVGLYARCVGRCMLRRCIEGVIFDDCTPCLDNLNDCLLNCLNPLNWGGGGGLNAHRKNKRQSTKGKHEKGEARLDRDRGGEKGDDVRRPPQNRPPNHKGPWPQKP
jgi:RHS repeat-associated protein